MKYVDSGRGKIPFISLIAILSISLIVNLPGLAVSPLLGKLKEVFPHVTELESQLLIVLPNFIIIPFILWTGKLCNQKNQLMVLFIGLVIYILSGVMFLFADSMIELILLSCILGIGCGLCIPLAASLIAQNFYGAARTKQLGMKSGISNFSVIFATLFVGWIASVGWHWAFAVYLLPIVPICLIPFMTDSYISKNSILDASAQKPAAAPASPSQTTPAVEAAKAAPEKPKSEVEKAIDEVAVTQAAAEKPAAATVKAAATAAPQFKHIALTLLGVIGLYIAMTYSTMVVSDYLPFTMEHYHLNSGQVGIATSLFFLFATLAGFTLTFVIKKLGKKTPYVAIGMCVIGLYASGFVHDYIVYLLSVAIIGYGYGIMQPIIYDKTAYIAPTEEKSTQFFAYTLTGNYISIAMVPFIVDLFARIFGASTLNFPYIFNGSILLAVLCWGFYKCKSFVFDMVAAK